MIIRRLIGMAAKGDLKAVQLLFQLKERYRDSSAERIDPRDLESDQSNSRRLSLATRRRPIDGGARLGERRRRFRRTPKSCPPNHANLDGGAR